MPFDDNTYVPDLKTFVPGREGLRQLSHLLRHLELWPQRFAWDFSSVLRDDEKCGTAGCALGIAQSVWNIFPDIRAITYGDVEKLFDVGIHDAYLIFFSEHGEPSLNDVTSGMVADAIDEYLANH